MFSYGTGRAFRSFSSVNTGKSNDGYTEVGAVIADASHALKQALAKYEQAVHEATGH